MEVIQRSFFPCHAERMAVIRIIVGKIRNDSIGGKSNEKENVR